MRIIIIIVSVSAGLGSVFLVLGAMFLFAISQEGDGRPSSINIITSDSYCFPSVNAYDNFFISIQSEKALNGGALLKNRQDELLNRYNILTLKQGTNVKVNEVASSYVSGQLTAVFNRVSPVSEPTKSCFVSSGNLEMEFYEWIKWKWSKI